MTSILNQNDLASGAIVGAYSAFEGKSNRSIAKDALIQAGISIVARQIEGSLPTVLQGLPGRTGAVLVTSAGVHAAMGSRINGSLPMKVGSSMLADYVADMAVPENGIWGLNMILPGQGGGMKSTGSCGGLW